MLYTELKAWKPSPRDIEFMRQVINLLSNGGIWVLPMTGAAYAVDKRKKVFVLVNGKADDLFYKTNKALEPLGWKAEVSESIQSAKDADVACFTC